MQPLQHWETHRETERNHFSQLLPWQSNKFAITFCIDSIKWVKMNLLFLSVKSGLKHWCLVTGVQSQAPFPLIYRKPSQEEMKGPDQADAVSLSVTRLLSLLLHGSTHQPKGREVQMLTETLFWIQGLSIRITAGYSVWLKSHQKQRERKW